MRLLIAVTSPVVLARPAFAAEPGSAPAPGAPGRTVGAATSRVARGTT